MRIPARQLPVCCRKHICMHSHHRPPRKAWKYHHHHMWLQPLPTGPLVLYDRALLSNRRSTRSLIVPSPVTTVAAANSTIAQDAAGQRWDQQHGWALNGQHKAVLCPIFLEYVLRVLYGAVCFDGCQSCHVSLTGLSEETCLPLCLPRNSRSLDWTSLLCSVSLVYIWLESGAWWKSHTLMPSEIWYAHCNPRPSSNYNFELLVLFRKFEYCQVSHIFTCLCFFSTRCKHRQGWTLSIGA